MYGVAALARLVFLFVCQPTPPTVVFKAEHLAPYSTKATATPSKQYWRVTTIANVGSRIIIDSFEPRPHSAAASVAGIELGVGRRLGVGQGTRHSSSSGNLLSRIARLTEDGVVEALYRRLIAASGSLAEELAAGLCCFRTFKTTLYN